MQQAEDAMTAEEQMQKLQKRARARAHAGRVVGDMHAKLLQDALVTVSAQQDEIDSRSMELQDKDANVKELRLKVMALEQGLTIRTQQFQMLQEKMVAMATAPSSPPRSQAADQEKKDDSWFSSIACCGADRSSDARDPRHDHRDAPVAPPA